MARGTPDNQGPIKAPAFLQGNSNGASDTRDMDTSRTTSMHMPPTGRIEDMERTDLSDMNIVQDSQATRDHAADLAFNEEVLIVTVSESNDPGAEPVVQVGVNGVNQFFPRGIPVKCKRKFVESLARAKPQTVTTADPQNMNGSGDQYKVIRRSAQLYPFQVIYDPSGLKGGEWLAKVMMEN